MYEYAYLVMIPLVFIILVWYYERELETYRGLTEDLLAAQVTTATEQGAICGARKGELVCTLPVHSTKLHQDETASSWRGSATFVLDELPDYGTPEFNAELFVDFS